MPSSRWTEEDLQRHTGKRVRCTLAKNHAGPHGIAAFTVTMHIMTCGALFTPDNRAIEAPKRSKYRNVKVQVDGLSFDSKHEAQYWQELRLREKAGEITGLLRQVPFDLVTVNAEGDRLVVATYIADMAFNENGQMVVADAKGYRTQIYALKKKWLALQFGIIIREVYRK